MARFYGSRCILPSIISARSQSQWSSMVTFETSKSIPPCHIHSYVDGSYSKPQRTCAAPRRYSLLLRVCSLVHGCENQCVRVACTPTTGWQLWVAACLSVSCSICHSTLLFLTLDRYVKPGFHYPSWRPELTGDRFPLPVNTGRVDGRAFPLAELTGRHMGRKTLVVSAQNFALGKYSGRNHWCKFWGRSVKGWVKF